VQALPQQLSQHQQQQPVQQLRNQHPVSLWTPWMSSLADQHQQQHLCQQQCHLQHPSMAQATWRGLQQYQARMGRNRLQLLWQDLAPLVAP
jgi:hypothetical protein